MAPPDDYDLFNRSFANFLEDLEAIGIETLPEYPMLRASCELLAQIDKKKPAQMLYTYITVPYEEQLLRCDEEFFLTTQLTAQDNMPLVRAIQLIWRELNESNKTAVWRHMHVLLVLSRRATGNARS